MRAGILTAVFIFSIGTRAFSAAIPAETFPCRDEFELIEIAHVKAVAAASIEFDEIAEIAAWTDAIQKLQKRLKGDFWTSTPADQMLAVRLSTQEGEIPAQLEASLTEVLNRIESIHNRNKNEIIRILTIGSDRAVATALRLGLLNGGFSNQLDAISNLLKTAVAKRCSPPVSPSCEAEALDSVLGANRRAFETKDLAQKLGFGQSENFQIVDSTRLPKPEADALADYLKGVRDIDFNQLNELVVEHESQKPVPPELVKFFEKLRSSIAEVDPNAQFNGIEVIYVPKGESRTSFPHFDKGPAIQVLTTFKGSRTWMQGADGQFFQIPELGDSVLFLTNDTGRPAAHMSPADFASDRVLLRIYIKSPKFTPPAK